MRVRHFLVAAAAASSLFAVLTSPAGAADTVAPTITLTTPAAGGKYTQGSTLKANYTCKDTGGSNLVSCVGTYSNGSTIPTQIAGTKSFKVTAVDGAGHITKKEITYTIVDKTAPTIDLDTPSDGDVFVKNEVVVADYDCDDNALGSGIASCVGTVADGNAINTATTGLKSFKVTAKDVAGNTTSKTVYYKVVAA